MSDSRPDRPWYPQTYWELVCATYFYYEGKRGFNDNNVMSLGASYCFRTHLRVGVGVGVGGRGDSIL